MIETTILDYLTKAMDEPAYMEFPADAPECFILLEKTGSREENHIENATLAIQSYAPSMYGAARLNQKVKDAMRDSIALPEISRCECNTDYNFTDTSKKRYRYQAVFDIVYLGGD